MFTIEHHFFGLGNFATEARSLPSRLTMPHKINYLKAFLARAKFQSFWKLVYKTAIYGRGFRNTDRETSGENFVFDAIAKTLDHIKNPVVFDLGASYGEFLDFFSCKLQSAEMHVFEPNEKPFLELKARYTNTQKIVLNQVAISDFQGWATLYDQDEYGSPFASLYPERLNDFGKKIEFAKQVRVTSLDKYWVSGRTIDFIKIDIEGAEEAALTGARNLLSERRINMIFFEHSHVASMTGLSIYRVLKMLPDFYAFRVIPNGLVPIKTDTCDYDVWDEVPHYCNILFINCKLYKEVIKERSDSAIWLILHQ